MLHFKNNKKQKIEPKPPTKVKITNGNPHYNEMNPDDWKQYYYPTADEVQGSIHDDSINEELNKMHKYKISTALPPIPKRFGVNHGNCIIDMQRHSQFLLMCGDEHYKKGLPCNECVKQPIENCDQCDTPCAKFMPYFRYRSADTKLFETYGYHMWIECKQCDYQSEIQPVHNILNFDGHGSYDSLTLRMIEGGNCVGIGERKLRMLCFWLDIPFPTDATYYRYDRQLCRLIEYHSKKLINKAINKIKKLAKSHNKYENIILAAVATDGAWHHKRYSHLSRNGFMYVMSSLTKQIIGFDTRTVDFNFVGAPGNMEADMQYYLLIELYNKGLFPYILTTDLDVKADNIMQQIMSNIEIDKSILKSYDPGHFKKKAIPKFRKIVREAIENSRSKPAKKQLRRITLPWATHVINSIFKYTIQDNNFKSCAAAIKHMKKTSIAHYCSIFEDHRNCKSNEWCTTLDETNDCNKSK